MSMTLDDLASMIKNEFDIVNDKISDLKNDVKDLKHGQEGLELKMTNVAYRFEMQEVNVKLDKLTERVNVLEKNK